MNECRPITGGLRAEDRRPAVYLCQVNETVSCGACCGLYNVPALSRDSLLERLARRTERFAAAPRTEAAIDTFRRRTEGWTPEDRPLPRFHHCPFLGLIGKKGSRVGCLLHPLAPGNGGRDWRYLSYYGAKACRTYFCPSGRVLPARYLRIMVAMTDDWYAYGLFISEHRLLKIVFETLEGRLGRLLQPEALSRPPAQARLRALFDTLASWPYRPVDGRGWCPFPFDNGLYERPAVRWPSAARPPAPFPMLFKELASAFATEGRMLAAVTLLTRRLDALAGCLGALPDTDPASLPERSVAHP